MKNKSNDSLKRKNNLGQAMVEYSTIGSVLAIGLTIATPVFSIMIRTLMAYLNGINTVLNYPLP